MNHLRVLARIYLGLGGIVGIVGAGFTALAMTGGEAGLLLLIGAPVLFGAFVLLLAGLGMLRGQSWGLVIGLVCCPVLIGTVFGVPLAAYTVFVAYHHWHGPRVSADVGSADPLLTFPKPSAGAIAAHMRILGSLYLLVACFPLFLGWAVTYDALRSLDDFYLMNPQWLLSIGFVLLTAFVVAAAVGLLRRRTWGLLLACIVAVAICYHYPHGTVIAIYTGFVAWRTYQFKHGVDAGVIG
jgi:uncharacterized membrane protein (UPF0136 family)